MPLEDPTTRLKRAFAQAAGLAKHATVKAVLKEGRLYYTLHPKLLQCLEREVSFAQLDPALWKIEHILSAEMADHASRVGLWQAMPVSYSLLCEPAESSADAARAMAQHFADDPAWKAIGDWSGALADAEGKLTSIRDQMRGYCGWLLANPQFIWEHDEFFRQWQQQIRRYGMPQPGPLCDGSDLKPLSGVREPDDMTRQYGSAYRAFLDRWALTALNAPYLPQPAGIQSPVLQPNRAGFMLRAGGELLYIPQTAVLPDRDALRQMAEDAIARSAGPAHLQKWFEIASADSTGKKTIHRFARLFQLTHFWGVLHHRWRDRLKRKTERLQYAFAAFFAADAQKDAPSVGVDSIHKDLQFIAEHRGGPDWYRQHGALDLC